MNPAHAGRWGQLPPESDVPLIAIRDTAPELSVTVSFAA